MFLSLKLILLLKFYDDILFRNTKDIIIVSLISNKEQRWLKTKRMEILIAVQTETDPPKLRTKRN